MNRQTGNPVRRATGVLFKFNAKAKGTSGFARIQASKGQTVRMGLRIGSNFPFVWIASETRELYHRI
jgi:hypothetical protein